MQFRKSLRTISVALICVLASGAMTYGANTMWEPVARNITHAATATSSAPQDNASRVAATASPLPNNTAHAAAKSKPSKSYGPLLGINRSDLSKAKDYRIVVIDAQYFTKSDIKKLHKAGCKVYSYLNIGALEDFRPYYQKFKNITLGAYEGWDCEYWVDVANKKWQKYITGKVAGALVHKGVDGFFLDNTDVYYNFKLASIYKGLTSIIKTLHDEYGKPVIVNGGDTYLRKAFAKKHLSKRTVYGVNQEDVFSNFDPEDEVTSPQDVQSLKYYQDWLKLCKKRGLKIYVIEYIKNNDALREQATKYCKAKGYKLYISDNLGLS